MDRIEGMPVIPKPAATIILLRERKPQGFEIFLLKRHEKSSFMAGNFVYPGGRVDQEDGSLDICSLSKGITFEEAYQIFGGTTSPEESFAHWIAGIRELFEEAGVLFAYNQDGTLFQLKEGSQREKFLHYRELLQKGRMTICQMAQEEKLLFALDQLYYYAHWITPEAHAHRFDTRFFLACHPAGQEASYDQKETTAGVWLPPERALEENLKGEVCLSPPTLKTIEDLSRFKSINELLNSLKRKEVHPILPILTQISSETLIIFPWDPEYGMFQKGKISDPIYHGRPSRPDDNTTRVVLKQGSWLPYCRID